MNMKKLNPCDILSIIKRNEGMPFCCIFRSHANEEVAVLLIFFFLICTLYFSVCVAGGGGGGLYLCCFYDPPERMGACVMTVVYATANHLA